MGFDAEKHRLADDDLGVLLERGWLARRDAQVQSAILRAALPRRYAAGETLYNYGDPPQGLFGIASGAVTIAIPADDGQEFVVDREDAGFWIGDLAALSDRTRLVTVTAVAPVRALFVPIARLNEIVLRWPAFYREFYALTHDNLELALRLMANLGVTRSDQRLALRLLHEDETLSRAGDWIGLSQTDLAGMLALSVPTLQRVLRKFAEKGWVEMGYGRLRVVDRDALKRFCHS